MKKIYSFILIFIVLICLINVDPVNAKNTINLHSKAYALIDGDSGRLLVGKNIDSIMPMASTTKIMTLILALESEKLNEIVNVSINSTKQPNVKLGFKLTESFYFKDLLYSMMLESHNDSAFLVGEFIAGSEENFIKLMNEKAKEIGLSNTTFLTINGLDKSIDGISHSTTSYDLALLMKYCIKDSSKSKEFIDICKTKEYSFMDVDKVLEYKVFNKNQLLNHYNEMLAGKTGFTSEAGYCYVGAIKIDGRIFIVALLGSGWPPNKHYKWEDARTLFDYGISNFRKVFPFKNINIDKTIRCLNGEKEYVPIDIDNNFSILVKENEEVSIAFSSINELYAPIKKDELLCYITIKEGETEVIRVPVCAKDEIKKIKRIYYKHFKDLFI